MAGIQLSGLSSGLDTATIINQLMSIERQPRTRMTLDQTAVTKRQTLLQDVGSKLSQLKLATDALKSAATWGDTQKLETADATKVTVAKVTGSGAPPGGFDVSISQLAAAERRTYDYTAPSADGTFEIKNGDGTTRASIALKAGATVEDAVAAINGSSDAKVYAVSVNGDLVLAAKETGEVSAFSAAGVGTETEVVAGKDAKFRIGDLDYQRASNVVSDALPGVQLTLKGRTSGTETVGVTVGNPGPDTEAVTTRVKAFVDAYNAVVTTVRGDLSEKRVAGAATSTDVEKGTLFGDSGLSGMLGQLRTAVSQSVTGLTGIASLADLGISTGAASATSSQDSLDGKLTLDTSKLTAALTADPSAVKTLLGATAGTDGFAQAFTSILQPYQGTGGIIESRVSSAKSELDRIASRLTAFDARMDLKEAYYQKQFTALETAMSASSTQTNALAGYINSL